MLNNLFRSADLDTQFACFLKQGIFTFLGFFFFKFCYNKSLLQFVAVVIFFFSRFLFKKSYLLLFFCGDKRLLLLALPLSLVSHIHLFSIEVLVSFLFKKKEKVSHLHLGLPHSWLIVVRWHIISRANKLLMSLESISCFALSMLYATFNISFNMNSLVN